jgi:hypothetical protein
MILLTLALYLYICHNQACSSHSRFVSAAGRVDGGLLQLVLLVHLQNERDTVTIKATFISKTKNSQRIGMICIFCLSWYR